MENASKALIIAGAILLTLLIIGLAMGVLNRMSGTISNANLNSEEAQAHNGKFTASFGNNVSAKDVKALLQAISANNVTADTADELSKIFVDYKPQSGNGSEITGTAAINSVTTLIKNGYTYKVEVFSDKTSDQADADSTTADAGYYKSGFLRRIKITQNAKGSGVATSGGAST